MKKPGTQTTQVILASSLMLLLISCAQKENKKYSDPLTTEEAMKHFRIADGFRLELFAAEPQVMSPVDMAMD